MNTNIAPITQRADHVQSRIALLKNQQIAQGATYKIVSTPNLYCDPADNVIKETGKKTLINGDTGEFVANMGREYPVLQMEDACDIMNKHLALSEFDLTGAYTVTRVGYNGARASVNFVLPAHYIETGEGDKTFLSILLTNSYDGSGCLNAIFGALRGHCLNGQFWGKVIQFKKRHNANLDFEEVADTVTHGLKTFEEMGEQWTKMIATAVTTNDAYLALGEYCDINFIDHPTWDAYLVNTADVNRVSKIENVMRIFAKYQGELGSNEFSIYNTLTHCNSHGYAASGNKPQSMYDEQRKDNVARLICRKHLTAMAA